MPRHATPLSGGGWARTAPSGGDGEVNGARGAEKGVGARARPAVVDEGTQARGEFLDLAPPVSDQCRGAHEQRRTAASCLLIAQEQADDLDGLAQPHVVREAG